MSKSELFYEEESKTARLHKYSINYKDKNDSVYAIKFYSMQKQIDEKDKEINRLNNIISELEKSIISKLTEFKLNKDYFIDEKDIEQLYEELKELKESGNNE